MFNEQYWKDKEQRRMIKALTVKRESIFNRLMNAWFTPPESYSDRKKHKRSYKERLIRRKKHQDRIR
jgi:hypothetical protein